MIEEDRTAAGQWSLREHWQRRHTSNDTLKAYATKLGDMLASPGPHPDLDAADPGPDGDAGEYRRTLRRDCCSVACADGGRLTLFFVAAWFRETGRATPEEEAMASGLIEATMQGDGLGERYCKTYLSRRAGGIDWLARLTPRQMNAAAAEASAGGRATRRALDRITATAPKTRTWGPATFVGVRVRRATSAKALDYFDRLDPGAHVRAAHGTMQPAAASRLRSWRDEVATALGHHSWTALVSWPSDRDSALAAAAAVAFDRQRLLEGAVAGIDWTIAASHVAPTGAGAAMAYDGPHGTAGPVELDGTALGWDPARTTAELAARTGATIHTDMAALAHALPPTKRN